MDTSLPARTQPKNNFAAILVSLYLVLLAFFIMLNAMSTIDEDRQKQAVESVTEAFSKIKIDNIDAPEWLAEPGLEVMIQNYFDEMRDALAMLAPIQEMEIFETKDSLTVRFPADTLFTPLESAIRHRKEATLSDWAGIVKRWEETFRIEIEALVGGNPLGQAPTAASLSISRTGLLARELIKRGITPDQLNIGIDPTLEGQIELTFVVRESRIPFSPLGAEQPQEDKPFTGYGEVQRD